MKWVDAVVEKNLYPPLFDGQCFSCGVPKLTKCNKRSSGKNVMEYINI